MTARKRQIAPGIVRQENGTYSVRVTWTDPRTGKRKEVRRKGVTSLDQAIQIRTNPQTLVEPPVHDWQVSDYVEQWLEVKARQLAPSSADTYAQALASALEALGHLKLKAVTPLDVRTWLDGMTLAPRTVNLRRSILNAVFEQAYLDELIDRNPVKRVKSRKTRAAGGRRGRSLTPEQLASFLASVQDEQVAIAPDVRRMILTLAWTGCRQGEVRALMWSDQDGDQLTIQRSVWRGRVKTTKSGEPRVVAIPHPLGEVLDTQRQWLLNQQHPGLASGLVFPSPWRHKGREGWYRGAGVLGEPIVKACKKAGLPEISPHALRRTYEDLLRRAGVDQMVRRTMAGWQDDKVQAMYASVNPDEMRAAAEAVVNLVRG